MNKNGLRMTSVFTYMVSFTVLSAMRIWNAFCIFSSLLKIFNRLPFLLVMLLATLCVPGNVIISPSFLNDSFIQISWLAALALWICHPHAFWLPLFFLIDAMVIWLIGDKYQIFPVSLKLFYLSLALDTMCLFVASKFFLYGGC